MNVTRNYLTNIPDDTSWGVNKLLTTRALSIDFKHRDSELFLRQPHLLDKLEAVWGNKVYRKISEVRANQLRFIYHIKRSICNDVNPQNIVDTLSFNESNGFMPLIDVSNVFLDFDVLLNNNFSLKNENPKGLSKAQVQSLIENSMIFSFKAKQVDMIKYFVSNNLPMPRQFMVVNNVEELQDWLCKNISFIIYSEKTFTEDEKLLLWACNYHLYQSYNDNTFKNLTFKTNFELSTPIKF